jgi:hypothetical protein
MQKIVLSILSSGTAFSFVTSVNNGKQMHIEKHRDDKLRHVILHSTSPYALSKVLMKTILEAYPVERNSNLVGSSKNTQQVRVLHDALRGHL